MPGRDDGLGKDAEKKIREWLERQYKESCALDGAEFNDWFWRIPDQMTGFFGSCNPCDFLYFRSPCLFAIESKATWSDRFDFNMVTEDQHKGLMTAARTSNGHGYVIVLFGSYKRAFVFDIKDIVRLEQSGTKSVNIKKIDKWPLGYYEIPTVPNSRKKFLDYTGELPVL